MSKLKKILLLLLGAGFLGSGLVACGHHNMDPEDKAEWVVKKINKELELNDAQLAKLNVLKDKVLSARKSMHENRQQHHEQVVALIQAPTLDQQQVLAMVQTHSDNLTRLSPDIVAALADVLDSLDSEQKQKLINHINEKSSHWERHHQW